jgi:glutaredoxin
MKITVYTVSDCQFSKAEKEYLQSHNLPYEEKNLEQNREWLTEMLAVSNNFAGTPVTKIEKDDGQIIVLKGFTKEEFDQVLGFKKEELVTQAAADVTQPPQSTSPQPPTQTPSINTQPPTPTPTPPTSQPTSQPTQPTTPPPAPTQEFNPPPTNNPPPSYDPLSSVLSDLEQKANLNQSTTPPPPANLPNIPNFDE